MTLSRRHGSWTRSIAPWAGWELTAFPAASPPTPPLSTASSVSRTTLPSTPAASLQSPPRQVSAAEALTRSCPSSLYSRTRTRPASSPVMSRTSTLSPTRRCLTLLPPLDLPPPSPLSNLPPIRVRPDDRPSDPRIAGLDDHFAHMNPSSGGGQRLGDDFKEPSYAPQLQPPPPIPLSVSSASNLTISPTENPSRAFSSDDDKSDQGGIRKPQQPPKPTGIEALNSDLGSRTSSVSGTDPKRAPGLFRSQLSHPDSSHRCHGIPIAFETAGAIP
ncbi:Lipid phosphate phosphatase [Musa troglodytarum]|uniref:Lipid phosphate phosphatase n=1 Tax=Musa troglodytarum TaxID=320322 RepID=A0A9E7HDS9_9LILI|nr:Lipid phosphate phosphatase [Musa troglodytarum]